MAALDKHRFSYNLWINGGVKLTKTREYSKSKGISIKEIEELGGDDVLMNHALDIVQDYIAAKRFAEAADLARLVILYQNGGVYMDGDNVVW